MIPKFKLGQPVKVKSTGNIFCVDRILLGVNADSVEDLFVDAIHYASYTADELEPLN